MNPQNELQLRMFSKPFSTKHWGRSTTPRQRAGGVASFLTRKKGKGWEKEWAGIFATQQKQGGNPPSHPLNHSVAEMI